MIVEVTFEVPLLRETFHQPHDNTATKAKVIVLCRRAGTFALINFTRVTAALKKHTHLFGVTSASQLFL